MQPHSLNLSRSGISPDGNWIAIETAVFPPSGPPTEPARYWVVRRDGSVELAISGWPDPSAVRPLAKGASPFGATWVGNAAVVYSREGALYLASLDGAGEPRRLTPEGEQAGSPVWLPGKGLVYSASTEGGAAATVRLMPAIGAP